MQVLIGILQWSWQYSIPFPPTIEAPRRRSKSAGMCSHILAALPSSTLDIWGVASACLPSGRGAMPAHIPPPPHTAVCSLSLAERRLRSMNFGNHPSTGVALQTWQPAASEHRTMKTSIWYTGKTTFEGQGNCLTKTFRCRRNTPQDHCHQHSYEELICPCAT